MLTVTTTHLEAGGIQRNGVATSDQATVTDHMVRHGDHLTIVVNSSSASSGSFMAQS